jgi:exportin-1
MDKIRQNPASLEDTSTIKILRNVLGTNTAVCGAAGLIYGVQFGTIYTDLICLYELCNQIMDAQIAEKGIVSFKKNLFIVLFPNVFC